MSKSDSTPVSELVETDLSKKMRALAKTGHPMADELRAKAQAFDEASNGVYREPQTHTAQQLLGSWARAARCWSNASGEPMI